MRILTLALALTYSKWMCDVIGKFKKRNNTRLKHATLLVWHTNIPLTSLHYLCHAFVSDCISSAQAQKNGSSSKRCECSLNSHSQCQGRLISVQFLTAHRLQ